MNVKFSEVIETPTPLSSLFSSVLGGLMGADLTTGPGTSAGKDGIPTFYSMSPLVFYSPTTHIFFQLKQTKKI